VPSIVLWVPFNEGWGQFDAKKACESILALDASRPIDHASGWHDQKIGQIQSLHVYFKPYKFKPDRLNRAVILSEFGGYNLRLEGHTFNSVDFGYKKFANEQALWKAYRDLYEQKGPLLYALYALCYLVSHRSFLGAWLLEAAAAFCFLLYACRCFLLFNEKLSPIFLFLTAALTYTAPAFLKGGSAEELCLALLMPVCFCGLRAVRQEKALSPRECLLIGLSAGAVLWIKYSLLGFYVGFILVPAYFMIRNHEAGRLIRQLGMILLGVAAASLPVLLYFAVNGALKDLWTAYFYNNLFVYGKSSSPFGVFRALGSGLASTLTFNDAAVLLCLFAVVSLWREGEREEALHLFFCFGCAFGLIYAGGIQMKYYSEILCIFIPVGLSGLWRTPAGLRPAPLQRQPSTTQNMTCIYSRPCASMRCLTSALPTRTRAPTAMCSTWWTGIMTVCPPPTAPRWWHRSSTKMAS